MTREAIDEKVANRYRELAHVEVKGLRKSRPSMPAENFKVFDYLLTGRDVTGMVGLNSLQTGDITSRISQIKKWLAKQPLLVNAEVDPPQSMRGEIKSEWKKDHNGKRYKSYWLEVAKA